MARGSSCGGGGGRQTNNPTGRGRANNGPPGPSMSRQERATPIQPPPLPPLVETVVNGERPPPDPHPNQTSNEGWQQVSRRRNTTPQGHTSQQSGGESMPPRPPTPNSTATQRVQPADPLLTDPQDRSGPAAIPQPIIHPPVPAITQASSQVARSSNIPFPTITTPMAPTPGPNSSVPSTNPAYFWFQLSCFTCYNYFVLMP
jgi:hypothetical protein